MGLFQADAVLKSCVELLIEDMRANDWLIDDIFSDFKNNPYLKKKFATQIQNAKDWFKNNKIQIELGYVDDRPELPRISIVLGPQDEDAALKTMGDASTETVQLLPSDINKPIPFVIKPFTPVSYSMGTGQLTLPAATKNLNKAVAGQVLVNTTTGKAFKIDDIDDNVFTIDIGSDIGSGTLAVVPQFAYYEANVEHTWMDVNYQIICTGGSDAQQAIWLHDITLYGLFRYRQGLLEALGLEQSLIKSGSLTQNPNMSDSGQVAWERTISISGIVEQTFIKQPHRIVEDAELIDTNPDNVCPAPDESSWVNGLTVASNSEPLTPEEEADLMWYPINDIDP